jgi:hypothetical protein
MLSVFRLLETLLVLQQSLAFHGLFILWLSLVDLKSEWSLWWFFVSCLNVFSILSILLLLEIFHSLQWWLWAWLEWRVAWVFIAVAVDFLKIQSIESIFLLSTLVVISINAINFDLSLTLLALLALSVFLLGVHLISLSSISNFLKFKSSVAFGWTFEWLWHFHGWNVFHIFFLSSLVWWFSWWLGWTLLRAHVFHVHEGHILSWLKDLAVFSLQMWVTKTKL